MNLIYLAPSIIPSRQANSVHVMKMCHAFAMNGHDVTLVARRPVGGVEIALDDVYRAYGVGPNFRLERSRSFRLNVLNILRSLLTVAQIRRTSGRVVYTRDLWSAATSVALGIETTFEIHEYFAFERPIHRRVFRYLVAHPQLRRLVAISGTLRSDVLQDYPWLAPKLIVAHDAADPIPIASISEAERQPRNARLQVGYVGHLYPGKGFEMIPELARRSPSADFHVVGGDPMTLSLIQRAELPENLFIHGHRPYVEAEAFRLRCDVLIAPFQRKISVTADGKGDISRWTSPLKVFEYMAAGKAILCSDLPVLREILTDNETALLVPPDDATAWTRALRQLSADEDLRTRLGAAARRDFLERFTWQKRAEKVLT